jgi:hypothetical protein
MKKRLRFPQVLAVIVLTLSTTACATTKTEYIRDVPTVTFPVFPSPDCVEYDEATDTVSMPLWYWQDIAEYKIDVDAVEEYLTVLRGQADVERMKILREKGKTKK